MAPEGWKEVRLGDVLDEHVERNDKRTDLPVLSVTKNRGIMLASERFGRRIHSRDTTNYRVAPRGTIVADPMLLWSGAIGHQKSVPAGIVSPDYRVYNVSPVADLAFMEYAVVGEQLASQFRSEARGTNIRRNRISRSRFREIDLVLPPLGEQRKIAAILGSVDEAIERTQAVIDQVQVVKQALMQQLLTRGLPGRHTRFKQTEIGEIPESWELVELQCLADVSYGLTVNKKRRTSPNKASYLTVANVKKNRISIHKLKEIGTVPGDLEKYKLEPGDILVIEGNGNPELLGAAAMWRGEIPAALHQNHLIRARCSSNRTAPPWLLACINSRRGHQQIMDSAKTSSGLHTINSAVVKKLLMPLPSSEEQKEICAVAETLERRESIESANLAGLQHLKQSLMSVLLTGQLRVTP